MDDPSNIFFSVIGKDFNILDIKYSPTTFVLMIFFIAYFYFFVNISQNINYCYTTTSFIANLGSLTKPKNTQIRQQWNYLGMQFC